MTRKQAMEIIAAVLNMTFASRNQNGIFASEEMLNLARLHTVFSEITDEAWKALAGSVIRTAKYGAKKGLRRADNHG